MALAPGAAADDVAEIPERVLERWDVVGRCRAGGFEEFVERGARRRGERGDEVRRRVSEQRRLQERLHGVLNIEHHVVHAERNLLVVVVTARLVDFLLHVEEEEFPGEVADLDAEDEFLARVRHTARARQRQTAPEGGPPSLKDAVKLLDPLRHRVLEMPAGLGMELRVEARAGPSRVVRRKPIVADVRGRGERLVESRRI